MTDAVKLLTDSVKAALASLYNIQTNSITFQKTRKEFEGDFTVVTFPFIKEAKRAPEIAGKEIGEYLVANNKSVSGYNVVKGFLNISLTEQFWIVYFNSIKDEATPGYAKGGSSGREVMVEYASPNTNKPLHLGHVRNILLGHSVAEILKANGHKIIRANLVNDRGIHICKSMLAWKKMGNGETPDTSGIKGDHLVGKYYVEFDKAYKKQVEEMMLHGQTREDAEKLAPLMLESQEMLRAWEAGNDEVINLWRMMNSWVYKGFDITFKRLGVGFDKTYYESNTYLLGKEIVNEGLEKNVFYTKQNGSIAIDLSKEGLDEKIVLRSDGTSVYITQDMGTAIERFKEFPGLNQLIYTVGNEQDYHFKVLFLILAKLGYAWAKECYHLSYGMVELPEGKMKSREGTVVDADELLKEMYDTAEATTRELGKVEGFTEKELEKLYETVSLGALKYFILKVDPKKKMLFDPKESIDFNGHTGPFIQYTYARIMSVISKAGNIEKKDLTPEIMEPVEKELIKFLYDLSGVVKEAGETYSPALVANYVYELAKLYNKFYHEHNILKEENEVTRLFRLQLSQACGAVIKSTMLMLGIEVPDRM